MIVVLWCRTVKEDNHVSNTLVIHQTGHIPSDPVRPIMSDISNSPMEGRDSLVNTVAKASASAPSTSAGSKRQRGDLLDDDKATNQCKQNWNTLTQMVTNWADSTESPDTNSDEVARWDGRVKSATQALKTSLQSVIPVFEELIGDVIHEQKSNVDALKAEADTAVKKAKTTPASMLTAQKREHDFESLAEGYGAKSSSGRQMSRIGGKMTIDIFSLQNAIRSELKSGISDETTFAKLVVTARATSQETLASIDRLTTPVTSAETG